MMAEVRLRLSDDHHTVSEVLEQLLTALENKDVQTSYSRLDLFWARLAVHIRAEHLHLFPAISHAVSRSFTVGSDEVPPASEQQRIIEELCDDHDFFMRELSQAVAVTRGLLANAQADAVEQLRHVCKK